MTIWTENELLFLRANLNERPIDVYNEFTNAFGSKRSYDAIQKQLRKLQSYTDLIDDGLDSLEDEQPQERQAYKDLMRKLVPVKNSDPLKVAEDRLAFRDFVDELVATSTGPDFISEGPHTGFGGKGATLVILLSDTHCGKLTSFFNTRVFTDRILSIANKVQEELYIPDLEEIVLVLAGDMLEGEDIYSTQAHSIDAPAIDQVQIAVRAIWDLVNILNQTLEVPVRIETCPGNHGRVSKSANIKTNWDNVIYQTLGFVAAEANNPDLVVNVNMDAFHTFPIQDKTALVYHHGTKHTGTPAMQNKLAGWIYTKDFDVLMHGHWHHLEFGSHLGRLVLKNGSLPGEDDLSEQMGVYDPPRQGYFIVRAGMPINQFGFFEWQNEEI